MSSSELEPRSYPLTIGDDGDLVIPAELQAAHGWGPGTTVIAAEVLDGVLLFSVPEALEHVRTSSPVSVADFLAGRRGERVAEERELDKWGAPLPGPLA